MPIVDFQSDDTCFFVTCKCNSNCIMCPMSEDSRQKDGLRCDEEWQDAIASVSETPEHLTITGGEPFLDWQHVSQLMQVINERWPYTPVLILTNGRALSLKILQKSLRDIITPQYRFAIPIHSSVAALHDQISQSPGSYNQTLKGLRFLSDTPAKIEIRLVGHHKNISDINDTFRSLVDMSIRIDIINLIAMEMMGCAARRRKELWVDYRDVYQAAEHGIRYAISKGVDVGLYNFPLCSLPQGAWPLARKSITASKIRYDRACDDCCVKDACGGIFYSTQALNLFHVRPFGKEMFL